MAGIYWTFVAKGISLAAATPKTVAQIIAASNIREGIRSISIDIYGGAAGNDPALVEIAKQTSDGTLSSGTVSKLNESDAETLQVSAKHTATVEPGTTTPLDVGYGSIVQGRVMFNYAPGKMNVKGGSTLGVRITSPASATATIRIEGEE